MGNNKLARRYLPEVKKESEQLCKSSNSELDFSRPAYGFSRLNQEASGYSAQLVGAESA